MSDNQEPKLVSRFEANLLRILHLLLRRDPARQALPLIFKKFDAPPCLSKEAVALVQDALAKGCISILARISGWWTQRHLRQGQVVNGRLWQRHPLEELTLSFSENTLQFLIWITAEDPLAKKAGSLKISAANLTLADRLFFYLVQGELRGTEGCGSLWRRRLFTSNALCRLAYPEDFAAPTRGATEAAPSQMPDFAIWTTDAGAAILEALQEELRQRWVEVERDKAWIVDWQQMQAVGQSQRLVLSAFLDAVEKAERRDLARFLFPALRALLPENPRVEWWTERLQTTGPRLADRTETLHAALELVRQLSRLHQWEEQARQVAFFDENYNASQLYKSDWEHWQGDVLYGRAQELLRQAEPLR